MDKLMVWSAWGLMAAVGSLSSWRISQTPKVDPIIAMLEKDLHPEGRVMPPPPPVPVWNNPWDKTLPQARPVGLGAGDVYVPPPPPPPPPPPAPVYALPLAKVGEAKSDLHGITITWTMSENGISVASEMTVLPSKPAGFVIQRQCEDGVAETLAKVGPEVRSFADLSTAPRQTYRYWVLVTGEETNRDTMKKEMVTKGLPASAEARTPSNVRLKLVGGDRTIATLRVETYDRTQKKWIPKTVMADPGRDVGSSGWTLNGLRFDNFTLVAELTDDGGVVRVLSTKD